MTGMLCQEVIELMQRFLDRDLDETEYRRMLAHLNDCPECTELFERLVNVSHELELLPKVTPPYSLVDAIMPKLAQLDDAKEQQAASGAAPLNRQNGSGQERFAEPEPQSEPSQRKERGWRFKLRGLISYPLAGGVLAAGLVIGFFIFQQQEQRQTSSANADRLLSASESFPKHEESASPADGTSGVNKNRQHAADDKAGDTLGINKEQAGSSAEQDAAGSAEQNEALQKSQPQSSQQESAPRSIAPTAEDTPSSHMNDQRASAPQTAPEAAAPEAAMPLVEKAAPAPDNAPADPAKEEPELAFGAAGDSGQPQEETAPPRKQESIAGQRSLAGETGNPAAGMDDAPAASGLPAPGTAAPEQEADRPGLRSFAPERGLAAEEAAQELTSGDGAFTAFVTQDRKVAVRGADGALIFESGHGWAASERIEFVGWSEDGKLTYRVATEAGKQREFVIDASDRSEAEVELDR
jgi:hypothetical protein